MNFERELESRPLSRQEAALAIESVSGCPQDSRVSYAVGQSAVHGKGVFARTHISSGERIGRFEGIPTQEDGMHVLWIIDEDEKEVGIEGRNALRFLNHADPPNAEFSGQDLFALCDVEMGSEILIHYGEAWEDES